MQFGALSSEPIGDDPSGSRGQAVRQIGLQYFLQHHDVHAAMEEQVESQGLRRIRR